MSLFTRNLKDYEILMSAGSIDMVKRKGIEFLKI